ncbi:MAG: histidine kinase, partial [Paucimonas sp.]|nr:histidine kinase [Paucimonas sp.]
GTLPHPILINTLPALYHNLVEALTPDYPRTSVAAVTPSVAAEHGGERARLTSFQAQSVITEYQLLRSTIIDVLKWNNVSISDEEMQIISSTIDACIREAATAFTLVQAAFQERFVATLAHDLRNPLAVIGMMAQLIPQTNDAEKANGYARKIAENVGRADRMIQELLDTMIFQQGERLQFNPTLFNIEEVVEEVCEQSAAVYGPRFETAGTSIMGWWGRDAVKRALENMISNAVKDGAPETPIRIAFVEYHGRIELSVHNEGTPIPPEQVESVFQVFRRAKAAKEGDKKGWGIGLPYIRSVAESHGGSVDIDSSDNRGTTVTIDIPLDSRPFGNVPTTE